MNTWRNKAKEQRQKSCSWILGGGKYMISFACADMDDNIEPETSPRGL